MHPHWHLLAKTSINLAKPRQKGLPLWVLALPGLICKVNGYIRDHELASVTRDPEFSIGTTQPITLNIHSHEWHHSGPGKHFTSVALCLSIKKKLCPQVRKLCGCAATSLGDELPSEHRQDVSSGYTQVRAKAAAAAKSLHSCPTLYDPIDSNAPGSPVPGILLARTLEWVAISFSNAWKWKVKVKLLSCVRLLATPWTAAYQAPLSMGFSRREYWSGLPLPSPTVKAKTLYSCS